MRSVAFVRRRLVLIVVLTFAALPFTHLGLLLGDGRRRRGGACATGPTSFARQCAGVPRRSHASR